MAKIPLAVSPERTEANAAGRVCGECYACCVLPGIPSLEKRGYVPCRFLKPPPFGPGGCCGSYADRPEVCRSFRCLWLDGIVEGDERRRPDRLGLMFVMEESGAGSLGIIAWELWPGAASDHPGRGVLDAIAGKYLTAVRYYGVPAALVYHGRSEELVCGGVLSRMAATEPKTLASVIDQWVTDGLLVTQERTEDTLRPYREGVPVGTYLCPNKG